MKSVPKLPVSNENQPTKHHELYEFCKAASHELSNSLGTVIGELDYALSAEEPSDVLRTLEVALNAAEKAVILARNVSYFALHPRIQSTNFDIAQTLQETLSVLEKDLKARRVKVSLQNTHPIFVHCDSAAIQQVLFNLVSRACHTMPQGGKITFKLSNDEGTPCVEMTDTGVGLTTQTQFPGSKHMLTIQNLELEVSRHLLEAQGATLEINSVSGQGTQYLVKFKKTKSPTSPIRLSEHRRFRRVKASLPVEVSFKGQLPFHSEITTLSVKGCSIVIPEKEAKLPKVDDTGALRIYYHQDQVLDIKLCRIANLGSQDGGVHLGIEFLEFDSKTPKILDAIVKSHSFE